MLKTSLKQVNKKTAKSEYKLPKSRLEIVKSNKGKKINTKKLVKRIKIGKRFKKVLLVLAGMVFIAIVIGIIALLTVLQDISKKLPTPDKVFPDVPLATEIYDRKGLEEGGSGTTLYRLYGENNSDAVNLQDIPDSVKASFLAAEDDNFFNHNGYDPQGIIRCFIYALKRSSQSCGGSTITQQLIKLTTKDNSVTVDRKIREVLMAIRVEDSYSKDQILEMYLRVTSYGSNLVGIKSASEFYFYKDPANPDLGGKEPKDLTLAQSAVLAAIVQNPSALSPTVSLLDQATADEELDARLSYIYDQMESKLDLINAQLKKDKGDMNASDPLTKEMIEQARNENWRSTLRPPVFTDKKAGHFVDYVTDQLLKRNYKNGEPFTLNDLQTGGYKIYTTMDYDMQKIAERYVKEAGDAYTYWGMHNAAVMTTQPSTGQILTFAGSKNFYGNDEGDGCVDNIENCVFNPQVNILTSPQSPGSTNKVMGYYLAYKSGAISPGSILPDIPIKIGSYEPKNWNSAFSGPHQSTREMLRQSKNLPALHVIALDGVDNYIKTAQEWGYSTYTGDYGPSVILGGADILPVEHAQAFSVFANGGDEVMLDPVLKILDKDGNVIYEAKPERKPVGDQQAVWLINQTLYKLDTLGANVSWDDRDIAAKTGTSEDNRDSWLMEWSPDFVTLGWGGNNNNIPMDQNYGYPAYVVVPWVKNYMSEISSFPYFTSKTPFNRPGFVYQGGGSNDCNDKGECQGIASDWLIQGREPKKGDFTRKKVIVCTDQQDKVARPIDISMGLSREQEFIYYKDPVAEYQHFLDDYIKEKNGIPNGGPTEPCTIDRSGGVTSGPFFYFTNVSASSTTSVNIQGGVFSSDPTGTVTSLNFYIDDQLLSDSSCVVPAANYAHFDITCNISALGLDNGIYKFTAKAKDDKFAGTNTLLPQLNLELTTGNTTSSLFTFNPPATAAANSVPVLISASYSGSALNQVKLCISKDGGAESCNAMTPSSGTNFGYSWTGHSASGVYSMRITAVAADGIGIIQSVTKNVTVP